MIHPLPSGTRDVLPDEMRELRAIGDRLLAVLSDSGYGEVSTPALEFADVMRRGSVDGGEPAYRLFDEHGNVLTLRSDMTVPIARLVATRFPAADTPLRFSYLAHAFRPVRSGRGHARELLQAGIELVGAPTPEGSVEALTMLCRALDAVGLEGYRVGVGDAALYPELLGLSGITGHARDALMLELVSRNFVGLQTQIESLQLDPAEAELLLRVPQMRGGVELLAELSGPAADVTGRLRDVVGRLEPAVADRVILDLGLSRALGYYTGALFEVYDPAIGVPIGGGGRYDDLLGRFGRPLPAVGWALDVERLHQAIVGERG